MKKALVLGGGGAKGAYELGVWQAFKELGMHFDLIVGSSIGALTASLMVQNNYEKCEELWNTITIKDLINGAIDLNFDFDQIISHRHQYIKFLTKAIKDKGADVTPIHQLLDQLTDENQIRNSPTALCIVTYNVSTMSPVEIMATDIPFGMITDYLMASSACFPAFPMHKINDNYYIDGGFYDNTPYSTAEKYNADYIISVNLKAPGRIKNLPTKENHLLIEPYWSLGGFLQFNPKNAQSNIRLGYLDTMRTLGHYQGFAYTMQFNNALLTEITEQLKTALLEINVNSHLVVNKIKLKCKSKDRLLITRNGKQLNPQALVLRLIEKLMESNRFDYLTVYDLPDVLIKLSQLYQNTEILDINQWWLKFTNDPINYIKSIDSASLIQQISQVIDLLTPDQIILSAKLINEECVMGLLLKVIDKWVISSKI
jgi:NTE family protein